MKNKNLFFRKYKIYIIMATLFLTWGGFVFYFIAPYFKLLKNDFDAVQMKLLDMRVNNEKLDKISSLRDYNSKVEAEKSNLEVIFSKDNIVELVKEMEKIAQETGNTIEISVDEENKGLAEIHKDKAGEAPKENKLVESLPVKNYLTINIKLKGNYNSLIKFVGKLNNIKYYSNIVSYKIISEKVAVKDENRQGDLNVGISVMNGAGDNNVIDGDKEKLILSSSLSVIFYSLENENGKK